MVRLRKHQPAEISSSQLSQQPAPSSLNNHTEHIDSSTRCNRRGFSNTSADRSSSSWSGIVKLAGIFLAGSFVLYYTHKFNDYTKQTVSARKALRSSLALTEQYPSPVSPPESWCDQVRSARQDIDPLLRIHYPCEHLSPAISAVVCMITAGVPEGKESRTVFSKSDYINGALALGMSLRQNMNTDSPTATTTTHMLFLVRDGYTIPKSDEERLRAVGWTIGTAPKYELEKQYIPRFARYATTYTKLSAMGLSEYKCVMLMDADTLAVGNLDSLMDCSLFATNDSDGSQRVASEKMTYEVPRLAGALDYYHGRWMHFNTGVLLYNTAVNKRKDNSQVNEVQRVYKLTQNADFMKRFESDQIYLNNVYPERTNVELNNRIIEEENENKSSNVREGKGEVISLPFRSNMQTHVEVQLPQFWETRKLQIFGPANSNAAAYDGTILHFTEKKGWQCPELYEPPSTPNAGKCDGKKEPLCFCREGWRYWRALRDAKQRLIENQTTGKITASPENQGNAKPRENAEPTALISLESTHETLKPHHCINDDFQPHHKISVWTMLNDNESYVQGALKLGRAIRKHTTETSFDLIVMTLSHKPLKPQQYEDLKNAGFLSCVVEPIPPPASTQGKTRSDLREKFAVLHVWAMTFYDTVLFLDADTHVQKSITPLLTMDLEGKTIGVTQDIRARKWVETFNSGVLLLHPSLAEYTRLAELLSSGMEFEYVMADQGFLNVVYQNDWKEIGFVNNANLALYRFQREFWDKTPVEDLVVIHYTMQKPWKCQSKGPYGPICDLWIQAE